MKVINKHYIIVTIIMFYLLIILCSCGYDEQIEDMPEEIVSAGTWTMSGNSKDDTEELVGLAEDDNEELLESNAEIPQEKRIHEVRELYIWDDIPVTIYIDSYVQWEEEGVAGATIKNELEEKINFYLSLYQERPKEKTAYYIEIKCYPVYTSSHYLVAKCCTAFFDRANGYRPSSFLGVETQEWYISIDRETGNVMKLEDYYGDDISKEILYEIALPEYKKLIQKDPKRYTLESYNNYYDFIFENEMIGDYGENRLEEYYHYYFTEDGLVIVYGPMDISGDHYSSMDYLYTGRAEPPVIRADGEEGYGGQGYYNGYMEIVIPYADLPQ